MKRKTKLGYSTIGGVFIGNNIQTAPHLFQAITLIISFSEKFDLQVDRGLQYRFVATGVIIQANTLRKFSNPKDNYVAFVHIEPFSKAGLSLTDRTEICRELDDVQIKKIADLLRNWFSNSENTEELTTRLIHQIIMETGMGFHHFTLDKRILQAIDFIRKSEKVILKEVALICHLSDSRFSHLFKQQTGTSFKEFALYSKLVKSLKAVYQGQSLTKSSYTGGFSDQAHFTKTYQKAFGILPSNTVK